MLDPSDSRVPSTHRRPGHAGEAAHIVNPNVPGDTLVLEPTDDNRLRITVDTNPPGVVPQNGWITDYPPSLIEEIYGTKGRYVCNEICREENPATVEQRIRNDVLSYLRPEELAGKRVLDFGCGCGASTMVLARLLPRDCEIIGIELQEDLLKIARLRARHFGHENVSFFRSPSGSELPERIGTFHCVIFSAVFEHLFSNERETLLPRIWRHLEPGGTLFLNQTPHRYSPFEAHTTRLPLINYLPDKATRFIATRFSKRISKDMDWETLLRKGIRGGTAREVIGILQCAGGSPALIAPAEHIGDRIDLWHRGLSGRHAWLKRTIWAALKFLKLVTRIEMAPVLALAIHKPRHGGVNQGFQERGNSAAQAARSGGPGGAGFDQVDGMAETRKRALATDQRQSDVDRR